MRIDLLLGQARRWSMGLAGSFSILVRIDLLLGVPDWLDGGTDRRRFSILVRIDLFLGSS